jgi:processive 1,2-diacylglycerol beta-glucosyltransferase
MGHHRAAEAISHELSQGAPNPVEIIDVVQYMRPLARKVYRDGYLKLTNMAPSLIGKLYDLSDSPRSLEGTAQKLDSALCRRLERHLLRRQPEIIISTHFLTTRVVSALKEKGKLKCALVQVITDFDAHALWYAPEVDHYCVAATPARDRLLSFGVRSDKISLTGIPLRQAFQSLPSRKDAKASLGRNDAEPLVLLTLGGLGAAPYPELVRGLAQAQRHFHTIVVCGKNEQAKADVEKLVASFPDSSRERFTVVGFTDQMPLFMAASDILVGKPGGLTSSEALSAGLALVLINPIPGQEERNADFLLENGSSVRCRYPEQLGTKVDLLLEDPHGLAQRQAAARANGKPGASEAVAHAATETALRKLVLRHTNGFLATEHALARLRLPRSKPGTAVFDLDNTILQGDIGESVFEYLAAREALPRLPIRIRAVSDAIYSEDFTIPVEDENLSAVYRRALKMAASSANPDRTTAAVYAWMNQSMAGLTTRQIEAATQAVWAKNAISLRPSALNLIVSLIQIGHQVAVVSASNQACVSWIVSNVINPALERYGIANAIDLKNVWGISNVLANGEGLRNAVLTRTSLDEQISPDLESPVSTFQGKAEVIAAAGYGTPVLVAGDSPNDFGMAATSSLIAWVPRGGAPQHSFRFMRFLEGNSGKGFCLI